ncbi:hypothetical protein ACFLXB_01275, partial [Chloroflexota bacterium]
GRSRATIYRCLKRMTKIVDSYTGEIISLINNSNGIWSLNPDVDLDRISMILGTAGIGRKKREQYRKEQRNHRLELKRGRNAGN